LAERRVEDERPDQGEEMNGARKLRTIVMALLGAAVLVLKRHYAGPGGQFVGDYAGNIGVSFALYFAASSSTLEWAYPRISAAALTLTAVTLFEITNGFGVMANVYDPWDLAANAAGVGLAVVVDLATTRFIERPSGAGGDRT
jgi:hypothetical protein